MYEKSVVVRRGLDELRATGLGGVADEFASHLTRRHVSRVTVETYLRVAAHFARWLERRGHGASRSTVRSFLLMHLPRCRCPRRPTHSRIIVRAALAQFAVVLRLSGHFDDEAPAARPVDVEVERFVAHLRLVCGADGTCGARRPRGWARRIARHRVRATTIHQARNRDFDSVIAVWPLAVGGDAEGKRRLLYNALTRARRQAHVVVQDSDGDALSGPLFAGGAGRATNRRRAVGCRSGFTRRNSLERSPRRDGR